jgi:Putative prokaryotic signal transducing protein
MPLSYIRKDKRFHGRECRADGRTIHRARTIAEGTARLRYARRMVDREDLVTIATFSSTVEGEIAKSRLESEGIASFLGNELASGMMPFLGPGLGGVSLHVKSEDAARAKEILAPPES